MSPSLALAYLFWTRHRRNLTILAVYLLVVVTFCRIVLGRNIASLLNENSIPPEVAYILVAVNLVFFATLAVALAYLLCIFSFSREVQRLEARESGFPSRLLHLPLPTPALAGWPMLWGSITLVVGWLTLAWGVLWPCGMHVPLGWPALLLAVVLAWLQAIVWTPFPLPWIRLLLFVLLSCVPVFIPMALLVHEVSVVVGYALLAVLLPAGYLAAIHGVSCARRGENGHWSWSAELRSTNTAMSTRPPFVSASQAQLWFEWRRSGFAFPLTVAFYALLWFPIGMSSSLQQGDLPTTAGILLLFMFLLASTCGVVMGRLPGRDRTRALSSFLATRPLSASSLVHVKFQAAAWSTLMAWAVVAFGLLLWGVLGGHGAELATQFETLRQFHPIGRFWVSMGLLAGAAVVLTWAQMAAHLWMGLVRHGSVSMVAIFFLGYPTTFVLIDVGRHTWESPEPWQTFTDLLPWLAGGAVVLKILAAAWSLNRLKQHALVSPHVLIVAIAAWYTLAIVLFVVLRGLIPHEVVPTAGLVLGIVQLVPLTRLALAPLALAWNRHR